MCFECFFLKFAYIMTRSYKYTNDHINVFYGSKDLTHILRKQVNLVQSRH